MHRRSLLKATLGTMLAMPGIGLASRDQPYKVMVGFAAGGLTDLVARIFAEQIRRELETSVIVENRVGAGGRLAARAVVQSAASDRAFLVAPGSSPMFLDLLHSKEELGYDFRTDLSSVCTLTTYPFAMVVHRSTGVRNVQEYIRWVKSHPDRAMYGVGGAGGQAHLAGVKFAKTAGVDLQAVPYKGNGPLSVDLMAGTVPAAILPAADFVRHMDHPDLHVLAVFEPERSPLAIDIPTFAEQGLSFDIGRAWMGIWTSTDTASEDVLAVQSACAKVLATEDFANELRTRFTMYPMYRNGMEMDKLQREELEIWRAILRSSGFDKEA